MKIYLLMCLNDVIGDKFYTDEEEVKKLVDEANVELGGDCWYKTLTNDRPFKPMTIDNIRRVVIG